MAKGWHFLRLGWPWWKTLCGFPPVESASLLAGSGIGYAPLTCCSNWLLVSDCSGGADLLVVTRGDGDVATSSANAPSPKPPLPPASAGRVCAAGFLREP